MSTPVSTRMPSSANTSASSRAASGSSGRDQPVAVLDDRHPDPEAREHLGQLAADRAAADHDQRARQLGDLHGVAVGPVRRPREPVDRRRRRPGAGVEHHAAPGRVRDRLAAVGRLDLDPAGAGQPGDAVERRSRPASSRRRRRRCRPSRSVASLARCAAATGAQLGSIDASPASAARPAGLGQGVGGPDHHLGRDAAVVRALAADQVLVDGHDLEAGLRGSRGERLAAGAEPDDDEVEARRVMQSLAQHRTCSRERSAGRLAGGSRWIVAEDAVDELRRLVGGEVPDQRHRLG